MDIKDKANQQRDSEVEFFDEDTAQADVEERLQMFGAKLATMRDRWVSARRANGVDRRWQEDLDNYHGRDAANKAAANMMESVEQGFPVTQRNRLPQRSTIFIGLTRQKTNTAEARLADILLPTDERNWALMPTPIPQVDSAPGVQRAIAAASQQAVAQTGSEGGGGMAQGLGSAGAQSPLQGPVMQPASPPQAQAPQFNDAGLQLSPEEMALVERQRQARAKSDAMQQEIDDALIECDYQGELRKVIHDAAVLGTGVLKGPMVISRTRKAWRKRVDAGGAMAHTLEVVSELKPASFRIDPRNVYPDPACGDDVQNGRGIFEYESRTARQVRDLAKQPAYMANQLRKALEEGPQGADHNRNRALAENEDMDAVAGELFGHWIYTGEVDKEDLRAAGVDVNDDELEVYSAVIEMLDDVVIRAYLNPDETGALPYDFYPWEKVNGSVWGFGMPYLMRAMQSAINSGWRQMMDNAGVSSGPQIVIKPSVIKPADGNYTLTPRKIWYATDDSADVRTAFTSVEFNGHQPDLANIIRMAEELSDQETGVPQIAGGNQGTAPETVGGMQMLMNGANVVLRRLVKQFDDFVTKRHIRRYYDFFMAYSEKEDIKGDYMVNALGSSSLIVRDIQNQAVTNMLSLGTNPVYAPMIRLQKLFERALKAQHIDPQEIMLSPAEIAQNAQAQSQQQQPDPRVQAAQVRAEADVQRTQAQQAASAAEIEMRQRIAEQEHQARLAELQLSREIEMLKLATQQKITLDQIKAELAAVGIRERVKQDLAQAKMQVDQAKDIHAQSREENKAAVKPQRPV